MKKIDITGQRFGRLTVIKPVESKNKLTRWLCMCSCGKQVIVATRSLRRGDTRSCGCLHTEISKMLHLTHGKTNTRLHNIWSGMKERCYNQNCEKYHLYGGRGVSICDEWKNSFETFYSWAITNGYKEGLSIDRIDNQKGYFPENCRWLTQAEQMRNTTVNHWLTCNGKTMVLMDWAKELNLSETTILKRLKNFDVETALSKPKAEHGGNPTILCGLNGETDTILGWSKKLGVCRETIRRRIHDYGKDKAISILQKEAVYHE